MQQPISIRFGATGTTIKIGDDPATKTLQSDSGKYDRRQAGYFITKYLGLVNKPRTIA